MLKYVLYHIYFSSLSLSLSLSRRLVKPVNVCLSVRPSVPHSEEIRNIRLGFLIFLTIVTDFFWCIFIWTNKDDDDDDD